MNARAWGSSLLWSLLLSACVLPDYEVTSSDRERSDAGADSSSESGVSKDEKSKQTFPGAEPDCERCAKESCQEPRDMCGESCSQFEWPVSPSWPINEASEPFVKCLASSCEDQCRVLWGCNDRWDVPEPRSSFSVTIRVTHAVQLGFPIEGLSVRACQDLDPNCEPGVGEVSTNITNVEGLAHLTLPRGFTGFFLVEPVTDEHKKMFLPMSVVWSQPVFRFRSVLTVSIFPSGLVTALAGNFQTVEKGKGNFIFKAFNCLPEPFSGDPGVNAEANGVVVNYYSPLGKGSRIYYTRNGLNIDSNAMETDASGGSFGGAFNVPPGPVSVTGVQNTVEVTSGGLPLRADWLGVIFLLPKGQ